MKLRNAVASALALVALTGCDIAIGPAVGDPPPEDFTAPSGFTVRCDWWSVQSTGLYAPSVEGVQETFLVNPGNGEHIPVGWYVYVAQVGDNEWEVRPGGWVTSVPACAEFYGRPR